MNSGLVHSELNFKWRLFSKTVSKSASWGFDRFRIYGNSWSTRVQIRRPDGTVVDTQYFNSNYQFEHDFSFDLSENINNEEYSVYIAGVPESAKISQVYAYPTGYGGTTGKNAEISYWDLSQVSPTSDGTGQIGRFRLENNPVTKIDGASFMNSGEIRLNNLQLTADNLADLIIGADDSGIFNGTFAYGGNIAVPAERALAAYNSLKNDKNWNITGAVPAKAPPLKPELNQVYGESIDTMRLDWAYATGDVFTAHYQEFGTPPENTTDFYTVFRRSIGGSWVQVETNIPTSDYYYDIGVARDTEYDYRVDAHNSGGITQSDVMRGITRDFGVGTPTNLRFSNVTESSLRISWDAADYVDFYTVNRRPVTDPTSDWERLVGTYESSSSDAIAGQTALFYDDYGLPLGDYEYQILSWNQNSGSAGYSPVVTIEETYDVDYQAKLDKATELGIPHPSAAQSAIYNQRIIDIKPTTGWINSSVLFDFSGVADIQFKLLCLKRRVLAIAYGGGTWSTEGWLGNGVNAYIDPLYIVGNDTNWVLNSAAVSWLSFHKVDNTGAITGSYNGNTASYTLIIPNISSGAYFSLNGSTNRRGAYGILGFNSVSRISATEILVNGVADMVGSNTAMTEKLLIGGYRRADKGGSIENYTSDGIGFIMLGGKVTAADYATLKTILE